MLVLVRNVHTDLKHTVQIFRVYVQIHIYEIVYLPYKYNLVFLLIPYFSATFIYFVLLYLLFSSILHLHFIAQSSIV